MSFLCPMVVGRKFPWKTYNVSKRSRLNGLSPKIQREEDAEVYEQKEDSHHASNYSVHNGSVSKLELASLLTGASLERPASVKASVLWNYVPTHATDIRAFKGDIVTVFYRNGEWVFVENASGEQGFIPFNFCSLRKRSSLELSHEAKLALEEGEDSLSSRTNILSSDTGICDNPVSVATFKSEGIQGTPENNYVDLKEFKEIRPDLDNLDTLRKAEISSESSCYAQSGTLTVETVLNERSSLEDNSRKSYDNSNRDAKGPVQNMKITESNETSSVQSDHSDKRKRLSFLSRRHSSKGSKTPKNLNTKKERKKDTSASKLPGSNTVFESFGIDSWNWYFGDSESSSDSSDEEEYFERRKRASKESRKKHVASDEQFVLGRAVSAREDAAYILAQNILKQRHTLLAACDDILINSDRCHRELGDLTVENADDRRTRHLSMFLKDSYNTERCLGSPMLDITSGFAQVRKLHTSTNVDMLEDELANLCKKELQVPKPKCLIIDNDDDIPTADKKDEVAAGTDVKVEAEPLPTEQVMVVTESFIASCAEEISVTAGQRVFVCNACEHEEWWWVTTMDGKEGFLPKIHLVPVIANEEEQIRLVKESQEAAREIGLDDYSSTIKREEEKNKMDSDKMMDNVNTKSDSSRNQSTFDLHCLDSRSVTVQTPKTAPKMAMVAPTPRKEIVPAPEPVMDELSKEQEICVEKESHKRLLLPSYEEVCSSPKFHSYENINSELFLESVREHLRLIDSYRTEADQNQGKIYNSYSYDDGQDTLWQSQYFDRYSNKAARTWDDRPRALRRRDTIGSSRSLGKKVRFNSNPGPLFNQQGDDDPVVVIHRYEAEQEETEPPKYVLKSGLDGEAELATWC